MKVRLYEYLPDTIIEKRFNRSNSKFDSLYNYYVFDAEERLIKEISYGHSIYYKSKGRTVFYDTITHEEVYPKSIDVEFMCLSDSLFKRIDNRLGITQIMTYDSDNLVKNQKMFKNDTILIGEFVYHRDSSKIIIEKYNEDGLFSTEIQGLQLDGTLEYRKINSWNGKQYEMIRYSPSGMILKKISISNGRVIQNLICIDKN